MAIPILVPASTADLPAIMTIIDQAKAALKAAGSPQWQTGYPNQATIETDLAAEQGWVLRLEQTVVGYLALVVGDEPTSSTSMALGRIRPPRMRPCTGSP